MQRRGISADIVTNPSTSERTPNVVKCDSTAVSHNINHFKIPHSSKAQGLTLFAKDLMLEGNVSAINYGCNSGPQAASLSSGACKPSGKAMSSLNNFTTGDKSTTSGTIQGKRNQCAVQGSQELCHTIEQLGCAKYPSPSQSSDSSLSQADSLLDRSNSSWSSQSSFSASLTGNSDAVTNNKPLTPADEGTSHSMPTLCKESVRQYSYVDSLVDVATIITDTLWPTEGELATLKDSNGLSLIGHFITETSRKSKTSLSTMQLALLYCIRFKRDQNSLSRAIAELEAQNGKAAEGLALSVGSTCARRNFLSALILASKYLQDRNFSNKAWSKISSVSVAEINLREREFLEITRWNLDVKHDVFRNWSSTMEGFVCQVRDNTMFGGLDSCHGKWTSLIRQMMLSSDSQMNVLMGHFASTGIVQVNAQLVTPLATPVVELLDFVLPTVDPAAGDRTSGTSSTASTSSSPSDSSVTDLLENECHCPFFEEFIKLTPHEHNIGVAHVDDNIVDTGAEGHYATPESLRTVSPALTETDQFHVHNLLGDYVSGNEDRATVNVAELCVPPTPKASVYGSFSVASIGEMGMGTGAGRKRGTEALEKEAGCKGTLEDGASMAFRRRKVLKRES